MKQVGERKKTGKAEPPEPPKKPSGVGTHAQAVCYLWTKHAQMLENMSLRPFRRRYYIYIKHLRHAFRTFPLGYFFTNVSCFNREDRYKRLQSFHDLHKSWPFRRVRYFFLIKRVCRCQQSIEHFDVHRCLLFNETDVVSDLQRRSVWRR